MHRSRQETSSHALAGTVLGLTSIAIGLTEVLFPQKLEQTMGINNGENTGILRVLGIREITHGIDLLAHKNPARGILSRVAGDVLDSALLGMAAKKSRNPAGMAMIFALVTPVVLADMLLAPRTMKSSSTVR